MQSVGYDKGIMYADEMKAREIVKRPQLYHQATVPQSRCQISAKCSLRASGRCSPIHCLDAARYLGFDQPEDRQQ
jgi:hypothetical protein